MLKAAILCLGFWQQAVCLTPRPGNETTKHILNLETGSAPRTDASCTPTLSPQPSTLYTETVAETETDQDAFLPRRRMCQAEGCSKIPTFGDRGGAKR